MARPFPTLFGLLALFVTAAWPAAAQTPACLIEDYRLVCGERSSKLADVAKAFASDETAHLLNDARPGHRYFARPIQREYFRRSVEKIRRQVLQHTRQVYRAAKRGRVSEDERAAAERQQARADAHYQLAMNLYRDVTWFDDAPSRFAEPPKPAGEEG